MATNSQQPLRRLFSQIRSQLAQHGSEAGTTVFARGKQIEALGRRLLSTNIANGVTASSRAAAGAGAQARSGTEWTRLVQDYKQLSKFKLSSLVVLTAGAGFIAASGESIDYYKLAWTCLGTFGAAACANTLNQIYEVNNDRRMSRTCNRPLPAGRMGRLHAAAFAVACGASGLWLLQEKANPLTAALGATNIALYAAVYTPLKQLTMANTWVGAVVGAIPPLMGWASASGSLDAGSAVLAAALFFWQMPHFLALAWMCKADYAAGGFRMISMFDPTGRRTALAAVRHSLYIAPVGLAAVAAGFAAAPFAWEATALAGYLAYGSVRFAAAPSQASARKLFKGSLLYLPLLLLGLAVHRLPNDHAVDAEELGARMLAAVPAVVRRELGRACGVVEGAAGRLGSVLVEANIKCPSKAAADSEGLEEGEKGEEEGQEEAKEEVAKQQR